MCKNFNSKNIFTIYFGITDSLDITSMRLLIRYYGDNWLFVKNVWVKSDGKRFDLATIGHQEPWESDNAGGKVWEWRDTVIRDSLDIESIKAISSSKETIIRFEGSQYVFDRKLNADELQCLNKMIEKYEFANGRKW
jgi:hypothetical protein